MSRSPIIVIGMHRSGTTLLTRMLEACGVFWGALPDEYNESPFFQSLNEALFAMASATWDSPEPVAHFFDEADNRQRAATFLRKRLQEGLLAEYCNGYESGTTAQPKSLPVFWGWKDPRNAFTLGLWLARFPDARVIHIFRSGIDVALSLWQRESSRPEGPDHPHYSQQCQDLDGCFRLWKTYVIQARGWVRSVESSLEIRFEDLVTTPQLILRSLAEFVGLPLDDNVGKAADQIRPRTTFPSINDEQLQSFIDRVADDRLMKALDFKPRMEGRP
jgi:hypothetical protein